MSLFRQWFDFGSDSGSKTVFATKWLCGLTSPCQGRRGYLQNQAKDGGVEMTRGPGCRSGSREGQVCQRSSLENCMEARPNNPNAAGQ